MPSWVTWLIGFILKGLDLAGQQAPSQEAVAAKESGSAETALAVEQGTNAEVQKSADAGDAATATVASDDGLQKLEQSDPNNRDRDKA